MRKIYFYFKNILRIPLDKFKKNKINLSCRLSKNTLISRTSIGKHTYIACNAVLTNTQIGNYCSIAPGVQIGGMQHSYWWLSTSTSLSTQCISNKKTIIGNDVWIAAGCVIKQGVTIGDGAVIGAMSFVNQDVPENSIYFGSPAKFYKERLDKAIFKKLKDSNYWNLEIADAKKILKEIDTL
ncbi:CatB-related O-acetyltransferase [Cellulophaga sp. HaHa_2_95]|uniref:acyltransferase n=1 Tax=Cellulophaga sp. HaHa_2_95 TaxID=2745558 RepID=UPI001C4EE2FD|nr:CatB-related O-acetyltransferase [Cellulophaga sp. HaHa_2_95]QXP55246.1 CatB-related O-acetyltransferase [Cellulophaga sp. HaHa_2_95]